MIVRQQITGSRLRVVATQKEELAGRIGRPLIIQGQRIIGAIAVKVGRLEIRGRPQMLLGSLSIGAIINNT